MKLLYAKASPYARKVLIVAHEKGLAGALEIQTVAPMTDGALVNPVNPLGKVPALIRDDGQALYDSPVICEYLDTIGAGPALIPSAGEARWAALRTQALADGMFDAAFSLVMESRRPEAERSAEWMARWTAAILRGAAAAPTPADDAWSLGEIALACAFGYLDFRLPQIDWRAGNPGVAAWYTQIAARPVMVETAPG